MAGKRLQDILKIGFVGLTLLTSSTFCSQKEAPKKKQKEYTNQNWSIEEPNNAPYKNFIKKIRERKKEEKIKKESQSREIKWEKLDEGLFYTEMNAKMKSEYGDSKITILKINPKYYEFELVSSKEKHETNKTAEEWAEEKGLIAVINAGMFRDDGKTCTGYMKNYDFINNSKLNKNYNVITAFNRKDTTMPEFQIIDLKCQNWEELKTKYNSYSQGLRMINCNQKNTWGKQNKKWSMVSIGMDEEGNALFIFNRSPYEVSDLNHELLDAPLNIKNAMYLEGGPEASFYLNYKEKNIKKTGSYETGFNENDDIEGLAHLPNVIGIKKKSPN